MNDNGAFRKKRVYFSQVSNEALRDTSLSLKAKGLYALIQSYITIENFTLYKSKLKKDCSEGKKAFDAAWKELKDRGYLIQYRLKNEKGTFYYEYELLDVIHVPQKGVVDHNPKKEGMDFGGVEKVGTGKGGIYKNTNPKNTNLNNTIHQKENTSLLSADSDKFFKSIKLEVTERTFNSYIKDLIIKQDADRIILETKSDLIKVIIESMFLDTIKIHLSKYFDFKDVEILSLEQSKAI